MNLHNFNVMGFVYLCGLFTLSRSGMVFGLLRDSPPDVSCSVLKKVAKTALHC